MRFERWGTLSVFACHLHGPCCQCFCPILGRHWVAHFVLFDLMWLRHTELINLTCPTRVDLHVHSARRHARQVKCLLLLHNGCWLVVGFCLQVYLSLGLCGPWAYQQGCQRGHPREALGHGTDASLGMYQIDSSPIAPTSRAGTVSKRFKSGFITSLRLKKKKRPICCQWRMVKIWIMAQGSLRNLRVRGIEVWLQLESLLSFRPWKQRKQISHTAGTVNRFCVNKFHPLPDPAEAVDTQRSHKTLLQPNSFSFELSREECTGSARS